MRTGTTAEINFAAIETEYYPTLEDDDTMQAIKAKLFSRLNEGERRVFLMYMDFGTYAGVAKLFGVSPPTAKKAIKKIIEKLK